MGVRNDKEEREGETDWEKDELRGEREGRDRLVERRERQIGRKMN